MALRTRTDLIVLHVSATLPHQDFGAREIDAMHRQRGFTRCGYAAIVRLNGKYEEGRGWDEVGAHVEGWNSRSAGLCIIGGLDGNGRPANTMNVAQEATVVSILREKTQHYRGAKICGHRDLSPDKDGDGIIEPHEHIKACPCFDAIPWAMRHGLPAANIRGVWDMTAPPPPPAPDERLVYLQKLLIRAGYVFGPTDGIVGKRTRDAIRHFQEWGGLTVTGEFDRATVAVLRAKFERAAA